jgi:zinc transporter ZupT
MESLLVSGAAGTITLLGGLLALRLRAYRAFVLAFCAGALVAAALVQVVPDAIDVLESAPGPFHHRELLFACALGFLFFYIVDEISHLRAPAQTHDHMHQAGVWGAVGMCVHSFLDGLAIGQGFQAGGDVGVAIALGVTLHKLADGVSVAGIMLGTQQSQSLTRTMIAIVAIAPIAGVAAQSSFVLPRPLLALLLGWFAGVFLYLGATSLLPTARRSSNSRALPLLTLAGVAFVVLAQRLAG